MKRVQLLTIIALIVTGGANLCAATLQEINIEGLNKTKPFMVEDLIGYHVGDQISIGSEGEIRQRLVKSGLFINESIRVQLETTAELAILNISLSDRFTLIPIPILSYSDGALSGGLFVMESNLMGRGHQLFLGGLYSEDSKMFMMGYTNPAFLGSNFSLSGNWGVFDDAVKVTSTDGDTDLLTYDQRYIMAGVGVEWKLNSFSIECDEQLALSSISLAEYDIFLHQPELKLKYDTLYYGTFFTEGIKMEIDGRLKSFSSGFDLTGSVEGAMSYQMVLHDRWQLQLNGDAGASRGDALQALSLGYGVCGTILPADVLADSFVQGNLKLQYAAFDFSWGYLAFPLAYQVGWMDGYSGKDEFFHGPAGGMALYLKKVAFPAMSFRYSYNMETGTGVSQFNLGISM